jgi:hypothetical protein
MGNGIVIVVVGGAVVVVVVVRGGAVVVVVVVLGIVVVVVVGGGVLPVVVVVGGDFLAVVVVVVEATLVGAGRETVVVVAVLGTAGSSDVAAAFGVVVTLLVGVLGVASNFFASSELADEAPGVVEEIPVRVFSGLGTAVVVEVAGSVLGPAVLMAVGNLGSAPGGSASRCTNPM